jgi:hypothetical protein
MSEENLSVVTSEKEPKQDKEALRARWAWVEHRVWTDSMLRSQSGFWKVWRNAGSAGIDGQSVRNFEAKEEQQLQKLAEELRTESYRPVAVKTGLDTQTGEPGEAATVRREGERALSLPLSAGTGSR